MTPDQATRFRISARGRLRRLGLIAAASALVVMALPAVALADGISLSGTVQTADGTPVSDAQVNLLGAASPGGWGTPTAITDASGQFVFGSVADGTYGLSVTSAGNCGLPWVAYFYQGTGTLTTNESTASPIVVSGADVSGLTLNCPKTYSISGRLVGPGGQAIAGLTVYAEGPGTSGQVTSGSDGSYTIPGLTAGTYYLSVYDESYAYQSGYVGPHGITDARDFSSSVKVGPGDVTGFRISVPRSLTIAGRVTGPDGQGLPGMSVYFGSGLVANPTRIATTGADGSYTIAGGMPSEHGYVMAFDPANVNMPAFWSTAGSAFDRDHASPLSLAAGSLSGIDLQVAVGRHITGTVSAADGSPIEGSYVNAQQVANGAIQDSFPAQLAQGTTGSDGSFSMGGLAPGTYLLQVNAPSGKRGYYSAAGIVGSQASATLVDVTAGDAASVAAVFNGSYYTITGSLTNHDGTPVQTWASVTLVGEPSGGMSASTDDQGNFTIANVAPGQYTVQINATWGSGYLAGFWTGTGVSPSYLDAATLTVTGDTSLSSIALPAAAHITGRVVHPNGIGSSTAALYAVMNGVTAVNGWSSSDGSFDLVVPAGDYKVGLGSGEPEAAGYYAAGSPGSYSTQVASATTVTATETGGQHIVVTQPWSPKLSGRLVDRSGKPLASTWVLVFPKSSSDTLAITAITDATGSFSIELDPGKYQLRVGGTDVGIDTHVGGHMGPILPVRAQTGWYRTSGADHFTFDASAASTITVGSADVSGLRIRVPQTVIISGTVTQPNHKAISSIRVEAVERSTGKVLAVGVTTKNGRYAIRGVDAGSYVIRFVDPAGIYKTGYYNPRGTVQQLANASTLKLRYNDQSGVNATLGKATGN